MNLDRLAGMFVQSISHLPPEEVQMIVSEKPVATTVIVQDALAIYKQLKGSPRGEKLAFRAIQSVKKLGVK